MPEYVFPCEIRQLSDRIKVTVYTAGNLKVTCYKLNWLYGSKTTVLMDKQVSGGVIEIPFNSRPNKTFIVAALDGFVTNVLALKYVGF